jgi:hypothetical protein
MVNTADAAKVRFLEAELINERHLRRTAEQKLGGTRSLNARLKIALTVAREEVQRLKAGQRAEG